MNDKNHSCYLGNSKGFRSSAKNPGQRPDVFIIPQRPHLHVHNCTPRECSQVLTNDSPVTYPPTCTCVPIHTHTHRGSQAVSHPPRISTWAPWSLPLDVASARGVPRDHSPDMGLCMWVARNGPSHAETAEMCLKRASRSSGSLCLSTERILWRAEW